MKMEFYEFKGMFQFLYTEHLKSGMVADAALASTIAVLEKFQEVAATMAAKPHVYHHNDWAVGGLPEYAPAEPADDVEPVEIPAAEEPEPNVEDR